MARSSLPSDHTLAPRLGVLAAALLFSTGGAAIKACALTGWQVASFRSGVAALLFLALLPAARRGWTRKTLVVALAYAATLVLFARANKLTTAAHTIFLQSTAPLFILLLGPWLLKERIRRQDVGVLLALAVGFGLLLLGQPTATLSATDPLKGNLFAALAGVTWAFTIVGLRSTGRGEPGEGVAAVAAGNLLACLIALPAALPVVASHAADWAVIAYLGLVQVGLAYICLTRSLRHVPALEASLLLLLEPVLNPLWAWLLQGERPGPWVLAGGALILASTTWRAITEAAPRGAPPSGGSA
jgi:drug/metabolite transporter (DMT)-like permease